MSTVMGSSLRLVCFAAPEAKLWGAVLDTGLPAVVLGAGSGQIAAVGPDELSLSEAGGGWRVAGEGLELEITPCPAPDEREHDPGLCTVTGRVVRSGAPVAVDCAGSYSTAAGAEGTPLDSWRALAGWFAPDRGVALGALRSRGHADHGGDRITATLFEPQGWIEVAEPRLSTTFRGERPTRASLELWVGTEEEQYPRRAAAEARGAEAAVSAAGLRLAAIPLDCHMAGLDGAGVYVLARFAD